MKTDIEKLLIVVLFILLIN